MRREQREEGQKKGLPKQRPKRTIKQCGKRNNLFVQVKFVQSYHNP